MEQSDDQSGMMMSEQPVFGKKPASSHGGTGDIPAPSDMRRSFTEEYEGFGEEAQVFGDPPAPVEGMWREPSAVAQPTLPPMDSGDVWKADAAADLSPTARDIIKEDLTLAPAEDIPAVSSAPELSESDYIWKSEPVIADAPPVSQSVAADLPDQPEEQESSWRQSGSANEETGRFGPKFMLPPEPEPEPMEMEVPEEAAVARAEPDFSVSPDDREEGAEAVAGEALTEIQEELRGVVAQHQLWLESEGKEGRRATFRGDRFRRADFSNMYLPEASFRGADLRGIRFRAANLSRVDFAEAELTAADFSQALLDGANFQRAQISHADFSGVTAQEADFSQCEGIGANFSGARLEWAILREAQLGEADLRHANLTKAVLRGAALFRVQAENANFTQADCRDVNFEHAKLDDALLLQTNFRMANLEGVSMQAADFTQALEVPAGIAAQSALQEREWLQQETQRLEILRAELLAKERELNAAGGGATAQPMGRILNGMAEMSEFNAMLKSYGKIYMKIGAVWLVMVLAVLTLVLNVIGSVEMIQLSFLEMLILGAMMVIPIALCLMGVVKSMNLSRRVVDFGKDHDS